jgi:type II secretory pathway predicted ATPase ExeA
MVTEWPLVGRDAVLQRLVAALADRRAIGPVVIHGPAGVGKTRLMAEALQQLDDHDLSVLHVVGSTAEAEVPFGAVAHLLPDDVAGKDQLAMLRGALQTLQSTVATHRRTTVVLAVDDAQWLDSGSAAVVRRAAKVADVRVVLTVREGVRTPDVIARLVSHSGTVGVALEPLTEDQIGRLHRCSTARWCGRRCGGSRA